MRHLDDFQTQFDNCFKYQKLIFFFDCETHEKLLRLSSYVYSFVEFVMVLKSFTFSVLCSRSVNDGNALSRA